MGPTWNGGSVRLEFGWSEEGGREEEREREWEWERGGRRREGCSWGEGGKGWEMSEAGKSRRVHVSFLYLFLPHYVFSACHDSVLIHF